MLQIEFGFQLSYRYSILYFLTEVVAFDLSTLTDEEEHVSHQHVSL